MNPRITLLITACLLTISAHTQSEIEEIDTQRCIATRQIKSSVVVDDSNVLFFMRGENIYRNRLPEACKGLLRYKTFSYRQIAGRICESDLIHVHQSNDPSIMRNCRIGIFESIDSQDIPTLIESLHRPPDAEELPSAKVEDIGNDP